MKKAVILEHDGGELGNQLWNYASIYAYCLEREFECQNYSFFEYNHYFGIKPPNRLLGFLFFAPFKGYVKRRNALRRKIWRKLYKLLIVVPIRALFRDRIIFSKTEGTVYYLPPTKDADSALSRLERDNETIFFSFVSGGVFRNPVGLVKHRARVFEHLKGAPETLRKAGEFLEPLKSRFNSVVGVHVRQGDYAVFKEGRYLVRQNRVREILDEYLKFKEESPNDVAFAITTDGPIDASVFEGLNVFVSPLGVGEDFFILASCDAVVGSDSTLGYLAAFYGDVPHIVMKNEPMDWEYYREKKKYFSNKYFTVSLV